jgi:hypothetical protein
MTLEELYWKVKDLRDLHGNKQVAVDYIDGHGNNHMPDVLSIGPEDNSPSSKYIWIVAGVD